MLNLAKKPAPIYSASTLFDDPLNSRAVRQHTKTVNTFLTYWGLVEEQLQWPNIDAYKAAEIILHSEYTNRLDRVRAENLRRIWKTRKGVVPAELRHIVLKKAEYCEHKRKNNERKLARQQNQLDNRMAVGLKVSKKQLNNEALVEATQKQKIYQEQKKNNALARERRLARKAEKKLHRETAHLQSTNK